jgi:hypothetical protein
VGSVPPHKRSPWWYAALAFTLLGLGLLSLVVFMALVWPPGIFLVLAITLVGVAVLIDVPRPPRRPRP